MDSAGENMSERSLIHQKAEAFFEELWKRGDPWRFESSEFEKVKYEIEIESLRGRRYPRVLEIGCGAGWFTRSLATIADQIVAVDISPTAIARAVTLGLHGVDFKVANIMEYNLRAEGGPWDLVVMNETICYLGWLYSFFDVAWLGAELFAATASGGQLLMANTCGGVNDYLLLPWVIRTYHDLLVNVGYRIESEQIFRGTKDGADIEVLISVFSKAERADRPVGL
jgi:predicted TPR repeat methyltransferase